MTRRYLDQRLRSPCSAPWTRLRRIAACSKASAVLGVSQPALTNSLHELEDIVGPACSIATPAACARPRRASSSSASPAASWPSCAGSMRSSTRLGEPGRRHRRARRAAGRRGRRAAGRADPAQGDPSRTSRSACSRAAPEDLLPLLASGEIDLIVGRLYEPAVPDGFSREPLWDEPISILARADHPALRRARSRPRRCAATSSCCPPSASASGRRSNTCSPCSACSRRACCAPAPTASSARCCWRPTSSPSCRG